MSREPGCGLAFARLFLVPVVLGAVGSLLPMGFGRPFAWHIGFIAFVIAFSIVLGVRFWRAANATDSSIGDMTERDIGELALASGALLIGDGPELRNLVRIDKLPASAWRVKCRTWESEGTAILDEVMLESESGTRAPISQEEEVVIDSGEVVVVDAGAATKRFKGGTLAEEVERLNSATDQQAVGIRFLLEPSGSACGIVFAPPYGDGTYSLQAGRRGGVLEIRIRVGGDS